jgi:RNA polymerase sigma factor (sigma-70 family)
MEVVEVAQVESHSRESTAAPGAPGAVLTRPGCPGGAVHTFEDVFAAEQQPLVKLAWALTGSRAVAEELAQEAFLRLHQSWQRVSRYDDPGAWVRRVLLNLAASRRRRLAAEAKALVRLRCERQVPSVSSQTSELCAAIRSLPRRQAYALALYYLDDLPVADIAKILGCAEGTVRAHLHAGRQTLKTHPASATETPGD